jgi:hypothetical protein
VAVAAGESFVWTADGGVEATGFRMCVTTIYDGCLSEDVAVAPWAHCAHEGQTCTCSGQVRYGAEGAWVEQEVAGEVDCSSSGFGGDPTPGTAKTCQCASGEGGLAAGDPCGPGAECLNLHTGSHACECKAGMLDWHDTCVYVDTCSAVGRGHASLLTNLDTIYIV